MDRRRFLLGAGALGLGACAQPERRLLDEVAVADLSLEAGPLRTTTTTAPPNTTDQGDTTDQNGTTDGQGDTVTDVTPTDSPYPVEVPEEDLIGLSFVAEAIVPSVVVHQTPGGTDASWTFANPIPSGGPLVFLLEEFDQLDHLRVLLPTRPNGSFGWIAGSDVRLTRHNYAFRVFLDDFVLQLTDHDSVIFETTIGVARDNAPTPRGRYYTTELIRPTLPDTPYGAYAYGLSGYSDTFTSFAGGPGQLGIHGTNDPDTLGTPVSSGCIRMHNDDITLLVEQIRLPVGVPVEVA